MRNDAKEMRSVMTLEAGGTYVNGLLENAGGCMVRDGALPAGDSSLAGEIWLMRHKLERCVNAEEGAAIEAFRRMGKVGGDARLTDSASGGDCRPQIIFRVLSIV